MEFWIELLGLIGVGVAVLVEASRNMEPVGEVQARARATSEAKRCPYCHEDFESTPELVTVSCLACHTPHHVACWEGCAVHGCAGAEQDGEPEYALPAREDPVAVG